MLGFEAIGCLPIGCITLEEATPPLNGLVIDFAMSLNSQILYSATVSVIIGFSPMETQVIIFTEGITEVISLTLTIDQAVSFNLQIDQTITV